MTVATRCPRCSYELAPGDRFCASCGLPTATQAAESECPACGALLSPGDRFCGACGLHLTDAVSEPAAEDAASAAPVSADFLSFADVATSLPAVSLLAVRKPFCRSCGVDHDPSDDHCPACGHDSRPLPALVEGDVGKVYAFRKKLRKRLAVRIGGDGSGVELLSESGETLTVELAELPQEAPSPVPDGWGPAARTPQGRILRLAEAVRAGAVRPRWEPDELVTTALDLVDDETTARIVALEAMALGRGDLADRLPLSASERDWLTALDGASKGAAAQVTRAVGALPADAYRPKLVLLATVVAAEQKDGVDAAVIEPQLRPYLADEPLARLLHRFFGFSTLDAAGDTNDRTSDLVGTAAAVLAATAFPDPLTRELTAVLDAISGELPTLSDPVRVLRANARALLSLQSSSRAVRREDVDEIPTAVLDDLIDAGTLDPKVVLEASSDPERNLYFRGRVAPARLADDDVERLDHEPERVRRAFRYAEAETLAELRDSPTLRHYRALTALRRRRPQEVVLDDVFHHARPVVADLLALAAAKAEDAPVADRVTAATLADPTIWPVLVEIVGARDLASARLQAEFPAFAEWLALHEARERLYLGEWHAAVTAADRCLQLAVAERVRDEALNLKACGLHYLGDDERAISALEEAIEGAYSEGLLANIGIVAAGLRPEVAGRYLGRLIAEAPTTAMRVAAAQRALLIWSTSDTAAWRNSDDSPLPDAFQDALRELVVGPIELDDFRGFASLLAAHDSAWFGDARHISSSPHAGTLEARYYVARAQNLETMVEVMGAAISAGSPPEWLLHERDSLRAAALEILRDNLDEPDSTFGAVALAMVSNGVLTDPFDLILFRALGLASITYHISSRGEKLADHLVASVPGLREQWQRLDGERRTNLEPIVELAVRRVAINRLTARQREIDQAIDLFNSGIDLGNDAYPGSPAYLEAMRRFEAVAGVMSAARADLRPWLPLVDHEGVREDLNRTVETTREVEQRCLEILR